MALAPHLFAIVVALALSTLGACSREGADPPSAQSPTQAATEIAPRADPGLLVRFRQAHPLGRAQALEAEGRCAEAEQLARDTLAAQAEFVGLCFNRFTLGGAEIVLKACAPPDDAEAFQRRWIERLEAMDEVEYVEANVIAQPAGCP